MSHQNLNYIELYNKSYIEEINKGNYIFSNADLNQLISILIKKNILDFNKTILDFGCGTGYFLSFLKDKGFIKLTGCDIAESAILFAKKRYKNIDFIIINDRNLEIKNKYDIIFSLDVIEHIPNLNEHLKNIFSILNSGGYYIITTPEKNIDKLFHLFNKKHKIIHPSLQTKGTLKKIIYGAGFSKINFLKLPYSLNEKHKKLIIKKHMRLLKR